MDPPPERRFEATIEGFRHKARRWSGATRRAAETRRLTHPAVAPGTRVYAVGDVHGCFRLLEQMLDRIEDDLASCGLARFIIVFLGDYVDRGPHSSSVLERLSGMIPTHHPVCLRGNHETLFQQFIDDPATLPAWAALGGLPTLMSYGLTPPLQPRPEDGAALARSLSEILPERHRTFLSDLPSTFVCGDYLFVHAGIRPGIKLARQAEEDFLWIRDDFLAYEHFHEKIVVHGHSPVVEPDVRPNRINIDTGAFATGRLTCLVLEGQERRFL